MKAGDKVLVSVVAVTERTWGSCQGCIFDGATRCPIELECSGSDGRGIIYIWPEDAE